jgi:thioredoxin 1
MKTKNLLPFLVIVIVLICFFSFSFSQDKTKAQKTTTIPSAENVHYKVTFIELGSVRCIPCQKMQPVMKNIEEKYGKEVKVVFHDVWTSDGKPYAQKFKIEAIPTQVFLDENGKEFFRHTGFFPEEELVKVLKQKGVK